MVIRALYRFLVHGKMKFWGSFDCEECEDSGMASYKDWIGSRGYAVTDDCRACKIGERRRREPRKRNAEHLATGAEQ